MAIIVNGTNINKVINDIGSLLYYYVYANNVLVYGLVRGSIQSAPSNEETFGSYKRAGIRINLYGACPYDITIHCTQDKNAYDRPGDFWMTLQAGNTYLYEHNVAGVIPASDDWGTVDVYINNSIIQTFRFELTQSKQEYLNVRIA